ncbi:(R)-citramalate synthase [Rhizocola hellebori]|uniref:Citramalate synthase n=1 Tax=Rhizocola hellebori TaxID=1392758 RepID=A0A8J3QDF3_9ACTN|nr:citramalate synthase [Rhizocola hellebori]GIH07595.1 (R)-citramalate synthase [Rhizocola hellebori]
MDFHLYDTTLRDGTQQEGLVLTVGNKLEVARALDTFGVSFIEGGWPGAIPKDTEFFRRARHELKLRKAELVAFGATRRPDLAVHEDPQVAALLAAETSVVTLVAKADARHVNLALRTTETENLAMIRDTVRHLTREGRRVFLDAEHFFDGYRTSRGYALRVVEVAAEAGAEVVVLCDTNGGTLPDELGDILTVTATTGVRLGIHCHDDSGCAVANTLLAVDAGATHVQVTAHGYGERCGNANLFTVAANLALKKRIPVVSQDSLSEMSAVAQTIADITAAQPVRAAPYVGVAAFTHKAGLHTSAVRVDPSLYQHIDPEAVGNSMRTLISDMAGRAAIELKAKELGYDVASTSEVVSRVALRVKDMERLGYAFETAPASFELLLLDELGIKRPFEMDSWRMTISGGRVDASVRLEVEGGHGLGAGLGFTPIAALDQALRGALAPSHPDIVEWRLVSCQCWSLDGSLGKPAATRAVVTVTDGQRRVSTVGVDDDAVTASWLALQDAISLVLLTREPIAG